MRPSRATLYAGIAFFGALLAPGQSYDFPADDRNGDAVISRDEWNGSMRIFRDRDRNNDGVLSGNELPRGWRRSAHDDFDRSRDRSLTVDENAGRPEWQERRRFRDQDRDRDDFISRSEWDGDMATFRRMDDDRDGRLTWSEYTRGPMDQTRSRRNDAAARTDQLDKNNSGAVEGYEWPYNRELFHQLDSNADSVLTAGELRNMSQATISQLDKNRNNQVDRDEWPGGFADFRDLDANGDGRVSAAEYFERGRDWQRRQRFNQWDKNGDGIVQSTEWQTANDLFHRLDTNANSQIEWEEFRADTSRYLTPGRR